jgi:hypothetical protein
MPQVISNGLPRVAPPANYHVAFLTWHWVVAFGLFKLLL